MSDAIVKHIRAPFDEATARSLRAGDSVRISGTILAARAAAHKRLRPAGAGDDDAALELLHDLPSFAVMVSRISASVMYFALV